MASDAGEVVDLVLSSCSKCRLVSWSIPGARHRVVLDERIAAYKILGDSSDKSLHLKSTCRVGFLTKLVAEGAIVEPGEVVGKIEPHCDHEEIVKGICSLCSFRLGPSQLKSTYVPVVHNTLNIVASEKAARSLAEDEKQRLLQERKLVLVVDLDQTLVHTSMDPRICPGIKDVYGFELPNPHSVKALYHVRLRPYTREFLRGLTDFFQMHVFTMGSRSYAESVAELIENEVGCEKGKGLFSRRVLSRDELSDHRSKAPNLRALFSAGDSMVVIIDDRTDVWERQPNVIEVHPYRFWRDVGDINSPIPGEAAVQQGQPPLPPQAVDGNSPMIAVDPSPPQVEQNEVKVVEGGTEESEKTNATSEEEPAKNDNRSCHQQEEKSEAVVEHVSLPTDDNKEEQLPSLADSSDESSGSSDSELASSSDSSLSSEFGNAEPAEDGNQVSLQEIVEQAESMANMELSAKEAEQMLKSGAPITGQRPSLADSDPDDYLLHLQSILLRIHQAFFAAYDEHCHTGVEEPCTRKLLPQIRAQTLSDVNLVFSGVIPTDARHPERHEAWRTAEALGACVQQTLRGDAAAPGTTTTHLVAAKYGTRKVHTAQRMRGVSVVHPEWLWCCAARWEHVSEDLYRLRSTPSDHRELMATSSEQTPSQTPRVSDVESRPPSSARRLERHVSISDEDRCALMREVAEELTSESSSDMDEGQGEGAGEDVTESSSEDGEDERPQRCKRRSDGDDDGYRPCLKRPRARQEEWDLSISGESDGDSDDDGGSDDDDEMANMLEKEIGLQS